MRFSVFLFCFLSLGLNKNLSAQDLKKKSEGIVELLTQDKYKKIYANFSKTFKEDLKKKDFLNGVESLTSGNGFESVKFLGTLDVKGKTYYQHLILAGELPVDLKIGFNGKNEISTFLISPLQYQLPTYGTGVSHFGLQDTIRSDTFKLPGEWLIPRNCNQCPVVVFVHGSGANDRDESNGTLKAFKDLALGLAANGVASFRYDKRNYVYPKYFKDQPFGLYEETIEDAVNAVALVNGKHHLIDTSRIVVLGHSQGGYALAAILQNSNFADAGISLAGCSRHLDVLIEEQNNYMNGLAGFTKEEMANSDSAVAKVIRNLKSEIANKDSLGSGTMVLGYWPRKFWYEAWNYNPTDYPANVPLLFLQGMNDFQVTLSDFRGFLNNVPKRQSTFILYPKLNHLMMPEPPNLKGIYQYYLPANIPRYLIDDISNWIFKLE